MFSEGDLDGVRQWIENRWISPFVVNKYRENLLHVRHPLVSLQIANPV